MNAAEMKAKCLAIVRRSIEIASRGGDRFGHGIIAKAVADAIAALPVGCTVYDERTFAEMFAASPLVKPEPASK